MSESTTCPICKHAAYKTAPDAAGHNYKCSGCGQAFYKPDATELRDELVHEWRRIARARVSRLPAPVPFDQEEIIREMRKAAKNRKPVYGKDLSLDDISKMSGEERRRQAKRLLDSEFKMGFGL